jgi:hypothetical protein
MNENVFYDIVAQELQAQTMVPGVWTRAFSEAGGQLERARALYIKHRVAQLAEEQRRLATQRAVTTVRRFICKLLFAGFLLGAFMFLIFAFCVPFLPPRPAIGDMIGMIFVFAGVAALFGLLAYLCAKASSR